MLKQTKQINDINSLIATLKHTDEESGLFIHVVPRMTYIKSIILACFSLPVLFVISEYDLQKPCLG